MRIAALFTLVTALTAGAAFYGVSALRADREALPLMLAMQHTETPTAAEFGRALAGTANQFTARAKVADPHCVQAAPGQYMCAFAVVTDAARECHIMQGRYTPNGTSTITVTLAGRTGRCDSLRSALDSLQ